MPLADIAALLDHLVGDGEQRLRDAETERLGGLEVDHEFKLGRQLYGQIGRLLSLLSALRHEAARSISSRNGTGTCRTICSEHCSCFMQSNLTALNLDTTH